MLEIDGMELVQSNSILRYVARKGNLYPSSIKEQYLIDVICDGVNDMRSSVIGFPFHASVEKLKEDVQRVVPRYIAAFEKTLQESKTEFFVRGSVTVADVVLFEVLDFIRCITSTDWLQSILKPYPYVTNNFCRMHTFGSLNKYLKSRNQLPWDKYAASVRKTLEGMRGQ